MLAQNKKKLMILRLFQRTDGFDCCCSLYGLKLINWFYLFGAKGLWEGKIFNLLYIPHLLRNGTWIYIVPPERPPHLTTSLEYWEPILIRIPMENMWTIVTILTLMVAALFAFGMRFGLIDLKSSSLSDKDLK